MKDAVSLLIAGIIALAGAFGVLYAAWRKDTNRHRNDLAEMHKDGVQQTKEFTNAMLQNSISNEKNANSNEKVSESVERLNVTQAGMTNVLTELKTLFKIET